MSGVRMPHIWMCIVIMICAVLAGCAEKPAVVKDDRTLTILWAKWSPSDYLQSLSAQFTRETGIKVIVRQAPWDQFQTVFFSSPEKYDLVGGDSQWLGQGVKKGIYTDLTAWINRHGVVGKMAPPCMRGYAEYPEGSSRYWSVPLMGDAMGFAYRRDLFEDPKEKAAFLQKKGYELAVPKTWQQLADIAEFFYRPEKDLYGVNVWASEDYDGITMGVETLVWAWGADLGDRGNYRVRDILNVAQGARALEMYKKIHALGAPDWKDAYLDTNEAFVSGKAAMVMSYFAFFPQLLDPQYNPYAKDTGFFANPAGPKGRFSSLGGQGLSVISSSRNKELALRFLEWFIREDVQRDWARLGGYSCDRNVLNSEEFLNATPYNKALAESMSMIKDFWVVPEYSELLNVSQKYWSRYLFKGDITAQDAMDSVAREWEAIFEAAGYYKE